MSEDARVRENLGLVRHVIRRMGLPTHLDRDDLMQAGSIGLLRAIREHVPERGRFSTFSGKHIRWAVIDELRRMDHLTRNHRSNLDPDDRRYAPPVSLDAPVRRDSGLSLLDMVACQPNLRTLGDLACHIDLARELLRLPERERGIVAGHALDIPQADMARSLGLSRERVRQILDESLGRIRRRLLQRSSPDPLTVRSIYPKVHA